MQTERQKERSNSNVMKETDVKQKQKKKICEKYKKGNILCDHPLRDAPGLFSYSLKNAKPLSTNKSSGL